MASMQKRVLVPPGRGHLWGVPVLASLSGGTSLGAQSGLAVQGGGVFRQSRAGADMQLALLKALISGQSMWALS